jgi:hypothetical protein
LLIMPVTAASNRLPQMAIQFLFICIVWGLSLFVFWDPRLD